MLPKAFEPHFGDAKTHYNLPANPTDGPPADFWLHDIRTLDPWAQALELRRIEAITVQSAAVHDGYTRYLSGCIELFRNRALVWNRAADVCDVHPQDNLIPDFPSTSRCGASEMG